MLPILQYCDVKDKAAIPIIYAKNSPDAWAVLKKKIWKLSQTENFSYLEKYRLSTVIIDSIWKSDCAKEVLRAGIISTTVFPASLRAISN